MMDLIKKQLANNNSSLKRDVVIFIANRTFALTNSRMELMNHLISMGFRVVVCAYKDEFSSRLELKGISVINLPIFRGCASIFRDFICVLALVKIFRRYKPALVHTFNAKPVIFTGIAARLFGINIRSISVVTGLGHAFIQGKIVRKLAGLGYQLSLNRNNNFTIFQNHDDYRLFLDNGWTNKNASSVIVGSGVDIRRFTKKKQKNCNQGPLRITMIGRLLGEKGVVEFVEAAKQIKKTGRNDVIFSLVGEMDTIHPDAIDPAIISLAVKSGDIEYLGFREDIPAILRHTDIFVLPSYREGIPRTILEASSCGIPCIGADVPGTREAVINGETGFLVPVKDSQSLAESILTLINDPNIRLRFGMAARQLVEKKFDIRAITKAYLEVYRRSGVISV